MHSCGSGQRLASLLRSSLRLLILIGLGCQPPSHIAAAVPVTAITPGNIPSAAALVAEGRIVDNAVATVPATFHGRSLTFVVDLMSQYTLVRNTILDSLQVAYDPQRQQLGHNHYIDSPISLDSMRIGTLLMHHPSVVAVGADLFAAPQAHVVDVAGWLGPSILSMFDIEFDLPGQRVRVYKAATGADGSIGQLPRGLTTTDCTPGHIHMAGTGLELDFQVQANGKVIPSHFDAKTSETYMNWPAAQMLGFTPKDVDAAGMIHNITLQIGARSLATVPIRIFSTLSTDDSGEPMLSLGYNSFQDRLLLIAYSTATSCISNPVQP